ncbi:hypothetical protein MAJ_11454, partial [Metarhizium majus ARSEF 297]
MKYSMLSVAAFVASSLASPAYFWDESISPGQITIRNMLNDRVRLSPPRAKSIDVDEFEVDTDDVIIPAHHSYTIDKPRPSANLELTVLKPIPGLLEQAELKYHSRGPEFTYWLQRIPPHGKSHGVVFDVQPQPQRPPRCQRETLFPGQPKTRQGECPANTKLLVNVCQKGLGIPCPPPPPPPPAEYEAEWL